MLHITSLDQFKGLAKQSKRVVISKEIYGDLLTPTGVFQCLAKDQAEAVLLDSSDHPTAADACIYLGFNPVAEFSSTNKDVSIRIHEKIQKLHTDPIPALRNFFSELRCACLHNFAKFAGGMIGFMSYDAVRLFENIPDRHPNEDSVPDLCFKFYATHVVFDKRSGKALIAKVIEINSQPEIAYRQGMQEIDDLINKIIMVQHHYSLPAQSINQNEQAAVETDIDDEHYVKIVNQVKEYIAQGEAFQVVPSRRFRRKYHGNDFNIYRALRVLNPSPYQFYIRGKAFTLVGSSPERLVSLQNGIVETMPIAGTRPRGKTAEEDQLLEHALLSDEKELAEHTMLVDLGRNDVGAICEPNSVQVVEYQTIKKYSRVMHIVSRVQGKLRGGFDAFDVLRYIFPAGTLSGAPKIRAMEIIDELEISRRGVYGGAVCAIDNEGQLDSCITIRTAFVKDGLATVRAGGGVVLDSVPQMEADETRHKAGALFDALALAERGFV